MLDGSRSKKAVKGGIWRCAFMETCSQGFFKLPCMCMLQVKYILGYNIPHVDRIQDLVYKLVVNAHQFKWREFVMGMAWIVLLLLIKDAPRWNK